ncbi:MAG: hypothetical protein LQ339_003575 [Xanthoria mediterranea]|nr:MAG: hypothetical protein LQ339_003575 [Xanthoria mediterranea]
MAARKLGGGRVLGSGRNLSPAAAALPPPSASLQSPSVSSVSVGSSVSTATDLQDTSARISFEQSDENNGRPAAAAARSTLVCPICSEEMIRLLSSHRHLDHNHKNLEEVKQDEVKDWFKSQMVKAKRFQPLAVLNQKFKSLDVFESNDAPRSPNLVPSTTPQERAPPDPDEVIKRDHWQRHGAYDSCSDPACGKRLGSTNGNVNCRKCGKLFCDEHTMYQMKLSRSAQHEPVRGLWCRVCETCYKSRDGYNDRNGLENDLTCEFANFRRKTVNKTLLEVSRLEKRLTKLTQLLANPLPEAPISPSSILWSFSVGKTQRKQLEQSVVAWEDDASVARCPFCQQEFSTYTFRRHHCRLCGRVVCGDPLTDCSAEVGLNVAAGSNQSTEKPSGEVGVDIRMCKECKKIAFSKQDFTESVAHKPPDVRAYENLVQFERGIRLLLPKFQQLLQALQDPHKPPAAATLAEASKIRKRLTDAFGQYNVAARRIRDLPTDSPTQERLQKAIFQQAGSFLHVHMLPLKALPKIMKHAAPSDRLTPNGKASGALASIKFNDMETASQASSSSAISAMEGEERVLREQLIVLEEQLFMVKEQIADASKRRKFDEVSSLSQNVEDLGREIDHVQNQLGQMDFAAVYRGSGVPSPAAR